MDKEAIGLSRVQYCYLCVTRPLEICVNLVLSTFTLLAVTQSLDNLFHSLLVLCENKYFLISNLH